MGNMLRILVMMGTAIGLYFLIFWIPHGWIFACAAGIFIATDSYSEFGAICAAEVLILYAYFTWIIQFPWHLWFMWISLAVMLCAEIAWNKKLPI